MRSEIRFQNLKLETMAAFRVLYQKLYLDDFAIRDILFEHLGRKLECECQDLYNERGLRKGAFKRIFEADFRLGRSDFLD